MDYISFGNKRLVGAFVESYVKVAFELAQQGLSSEDFDSKLINSVSEECGLSKEVVLGLHHPFHWAFFNSENDFSPFKIHSSGKPKGLQYVKIVKEKYTEMERGKILLSMSNEIIDNYGNLLIAKRERMINQSA